MHYIQIIQLHMNPRYIPKPYKSTTSKKLHPSLHTIPCKQNKSVPHTRLNIPYFPDNISNKNGNGLIQLQTDPPTWKSPASNKYRVIFREFASSFTLLPFPSPASRRDQPSETFDVGQMGNVSDVCGCDAYWRLPWRYVYVYAFILVLEDAKFEIIAFSMNFRFWNRTIGSYLRWLSYL